MRTNSIGSGTRNLSVNAPADWVLELGRAAVRAGARSVGEFVRGLVERGAAAGDPALALRLREVRRQYYGRAFLAIFIVTLVASWFAHDEGDVRRARGQRARIVRTLRIGRAEQEVDV